MIQLKKLNFTVEEIEEFMEEDIQVIYASLDALDERAKELRPNE